MLGEGGVCFVLFASLFFLGDSFLKAIWGGGGGRRGDGREGKG